MKNKFATRFKQLREAESLTQAKLAAEFEVTIQTISAWEKSLQETDFDRLVQIAQYFGVSTDYLLGLEE